MNEVSSAELPFLDLGNDARVSANGKFFGVDDASVMLNETELPSFLPFPFGNGTETRIYVSYNCKHFLTNLLIIYNYVDFK